MRPILVLRKLHCIQTYNSYPKLEPPLIDTILINEETRNDSILALTPLSKEAFEFDDLSDAFFNASKCEL